MARGQSITVEIDSSSFLEGMNRVFRFIKRAAFKSPARVAFELERDSKPFIPIETGVLRDSSVINRVNQTSVQLGWIAESPGGFHYPEVQYRKIFFHVDGVFAAEWVDKAQQANPQKYITIMFKDVVTAVRLATRKTV